MLRRFSRCPQQVVRVGIVKFREQHDTWTNCSINIAADRRPTNLVSAWHAERGSRPTRASSSRGCRACRRGCQEDAIRELLPWNLSLSGCVCGERWLEHGAARVLDCHVRPKGFSVTYFYASSLKFYGVHVLPPPS